MVVDLEKLEMGWSLVKDHLCWRLGNGEKIKCMLDRWCRREMNNLVRHEDMHVSMKNGRER